MRKIVFALIALTLSPLCFAQIYPTLPPSPRSASYNTPAVVQSNCGTLGTATPTATVTLSSPVAAGDTIVAYGLLTDNVTFTSFTDTSGNTYAAAPTNAILNWTENVSYLILYSAANVKAAAGGDTITLTASGTPTYINLACAVEVTNVAASPVDVSNGAIISNSGSAGTQFYSGNLVTTQSTEMIFGAAIIGAGPISAGTGFTQILSLDSVLVLEYKNVTTTGTYQSSASSGAASDNGVIQAIALKAN